MKTEIKLITIPFLGLLLFVSSCCSTYNGYGRYVLKTNCGKVIIENDTFKLTKEYNDYMLDGHSLTRGIYRKTTPWLYVHRIEENLVELTFDPGSKPPYPTYNTSISDVYRKPWELKLTYAAQFDNNYWLVLNKFGTNGVYLDLQQSVSPDHKKWNLVQADKFVNANGEYTEFLEINTKVKVIAINYNTKTVTLSFEMI